MFSRTTGYEARIMKGNARKPAIHIEFDANRKDAARSAAIAYASTIKDRVRYDKIITVSTSRVTKLSAEGRADLIQVPHADIQWFKFRICPAGIFEA